MTSVAPDDMAAESDFAVGRADVAVAFTDLEGFTAFTAAKGDNAAECLLRTHHGHAERLAANRGGRVVKRLGDGLMLVFASPPAAVMTCLELRETAPLRMRAGVHCGSVNMTDDGDIVGHVVNLAARVATSARPGELLVTDAVRLAVATLSCLVFADPQRRRFKGLDQLTAVSATSRIDCDWNPNQSRRGGANLAPNTTIDERKHPCPPRPATTSQRTHPPATP